MRIKNHPILGEDKGIETVTIYCDGEAVMAKKDEPIASALLAHGIKVCRHTAKTQEPRGVFCGIGQCTDCVMEVDGRINTRTCITPVADGMIVNTQEGNGTWK